MHEFSVAQSIVDTVLSVAKENGASRVIELNLHVGEVALVNGDQLGWYIDMLTKDTPAEGMMTRLTKIPARIRCFECGYEGGVNYRESESSADHAAPSFQCPECESAQTFITAGRELQIKDINVMFADEETEGDGDNA